MQELPTDQITEQLVELSRDKISHILHRKCKRLLAIVGPCSVHDPESALVYAEKLANVRSQISDQIEVVMRVYFEKPRTTVGWKGLINDPDLDNSYNIDKGIRLARKLMIDISSLGLPIGTEFLDIVTGQYYSDLVSWGAIGARTTESQVHRELASGLSCPIGFKNGTSGNLQVAIDAVRAARHQHIFLSPTHEGTTAIFETKGNQDAHIILRGGKEPNYDAANVSKAVSQKDKASIPTGIIIDFSHGNSQKQFKKQLDIAENVSDQIVSGNTHISGFMLESYLEEGRQAVTLDEPLIFGKSITDGCLGWDDTESLLISFANKLRMRPQH